MTLPYVSIVIPTTFSRLRFSRLLFENINSQTYPHNLIELVIVGDEDVRTKELFLQMFKCLKDMRCIYVECDIMDNIGKKRNFCCEQTTSEIIVNMDDDDVYNKEYLEYSVKYMKQHKKDIVGCKDMLVLYPNKCMKMMYVNGVHIHEATMVFHKHHWEKYKFAETSHSEGKQMVNGRYHNEMDIRKIMVCISHGSNTFSKNLILESGAIVQMNDKMKSHLENIMKLIGN